MNKMKFLQVCKKFLSRPKFELLQDESDQCQGLTIDGPRGDLAKTLQDQETWTYPSYNKRQDRH